MRYGTIFMGLMALLIVPKPSYAQYPTLSTITQASLDTLAASIPQPSNATPNMESLTGSAGSVSNKYLMEGWTPKRISRSVSGTSDASGIVTLTWAALPTVPKLDVTPYVTSTETAPPSCYPVLTTITTTGGTVRCYIDQSILGLGLMPKKPAAAGVYVDVLVLPAS